MSNQDVIVKPDKNEWTLMFFFAGDNTLSPSMISQLKALKDAGFQKDTTVLARFDPSERVAPTRIFEVNRKRKRGTRQTIIGDGKDPFVRNLKDDNVTRADIENDETEEGIKIPVGESLTPLIHELERSDTMIAAEALDTFLRFCRLKHPAKHYMLFLIGHGMIVGSDAFLPDDRPDTAITLRQLGIILKRFTDPVKAKGEALELVGMHSCSMSGIEVAYQLKDTAKYMMATEGISFVGSWPYRQLLKKIFNTVDGANGNGANAKEDAEGNQVAATENATMNEDAVKTLLRKLYYLCLHNSTDFMFAGFSADLVLCNLNGKKVDALNVPLTELTRALKDGLDDPRIEELILLAHWKSQSYFQETYADLYDFCDCLRKKCDEGDARQKRIKEACDAVIEKFPTPPNESSSLQENLQAFENLVVYSEHFGPTYQYSHGFSIYFPWSRPVEDEIKKGLRKAQVEDEAKKVQVEDELEEDQARFKTVLERYEKYAFTEALGGDSWFSFLQKYFDITQRKSREDEDRAGKTAGDSRETAAAAAAASGPGLPAGVPPQAAAGLNNSDSLEGKPSPSLTGKTSPADSGGVSCNCASIKNYPIEFSPSPGVRWKDPR